MRLASMPLKAQILAFAQASHVIGAEGAGLSNAIYLARNLRETDVLTPSALPRDRFCSVISLVPHSFDCGVSYIWRLSIAVACEFAGFRVKDWADLHDVLHVKVKALKRFLAEFWGTGKVASARSPAPQAHTGEL